MASTITITSLEDAIRRAVDEQIENLTKQLVEEAKVQIAAKIPDIVAATSLRVQKMFDVRHMGNNLVITVCLKGEL